MLFVSSVLCLGGRNSGWEWVTQGAEHHSRLMTHWGHGSGESGLSHPLFNQSTVTSLFIIFSLTSSVFKRGFAEKKSTKPETHCYLFWVHFFTSCFWIEYFMIISSFFYYLISHISVLWYLSGFFMAYNICL